MKSVMQDIANKVIWELNFKVKVIVFRGLKSILFSLFCSSIVQTKSKMPAKKKRKASY